MSSDSSPFYPPRARGWRRFRGVRFALRRMRYACPFEVPKGLGWTICSFLVPGYTFRILGYRLVARLVIAAYLVAALGFIVALGLPAANYFFAAMIALHAVSAFFALARIFPTEEFAGRFWRAATVLALLIIGYSFALALFGHVVTPLEFNKKVYVINRLVSAGGVTRGEHVAYRIESNAERFGGAGYHGTIIVEDGFGFGDVLAISGDTIEFTPAALVINGIPQQRKARMPATGSIVVPENHWFIWPEFAINMHGQAAEIQANEMLARMGMVNAKDFVGRVFGRWFWRKQL